MNFLPDRDYRERMESRRCGWLLASVVIGLLLIVACLVWTLKGCGG